MTEPEAEDVPTPVELIADLNRITGPDGIVEDHVVELGGVPQVVSVRGQDRTNPVLLCVHGGPGAPLSPSSWMWQRPLEDFFTVVQHDQRAAGRTHALTPAEEVRPTLTTDQYVDDLLALAEWLVDHLEVERVALLGHSWGSVLATTAVARRPELFSVYAGVGQVVWFDEGERVSWRAVLSEARRRGDRAAVAELEGLAPYPGPPGDGTALLPRLAAERAWVTRYGGFAAYRDSCDYFAYGELTTGWDETELRSSLEGSALQGETVLPQLRDVDLRGITRLDVPVVQVLGRHDLMTPTGPVLTWLDAVDAPSLVTLWFERSAHLAMYEETGRFVVAMHEHVLPHARAYPGRGQDPSTGDG